MGGTLETQRREGTMPDDETAAGAPATTTRPERYARRDPVSPAHDGPDPRSAARLDGATALRLAFRRRRAAREAIGERRGGSVADPWPGPSSLPLGFGSADVDDELI
jgi:hypothetical protein